MPVDLPPPRPQRSGHRPSLGEAVERLRAKRGGIIGFGALCAVLGLLALILVETATIASVLVIGVFMALAGLVEIAVGFRTRTWGRLLPVGGGGPGLSACRNLRHRAARTRLGRSSPFCWAPAWSPRDCCASFWGCASRGSRSKAGIIGAGAVTALLGLLILASWPGSSVLVLGTVLGIDLLVYGFTWIMFGVRIGQKRS